MYSSVNRVNTGSDNGLAPIRRQAIIWTNAGLLSIGPSGTNISEILIKIQNFSFKKMHLKILSAKMRVNPLYTELFCGPQTCICISYDDSLILKTHRLLKFTLRTDKDMQHIYVTNTMPGYGLSIQQAGTLPGIVIIHWPPGRCGSNFMIVVIQTYYAEK